MSKQSFSNQGVSSTFKGITEEYRKSDEYKNWFKAIKLDFPNMPDYLIEMSISAHKLDPQYYKKAAKEEKKIIKDENLQFASPFPLKEGVRGNFVPPDYNLVNVYNSVDDIPPNKDDNLPTVKIILDKNKE